LGAPVLRLECFNPSILKTEPLPVTRAQSTWLLSFQLIRAAFSRESGFVRCRVARRNFTSGRSQNRA
jgi:hypothetical protein